MYNFVYWCLVLGSGFMTLIVAVVLLLLCLH